MYDTHTVMCYTYVVGVYMCAYRQGWYTHTIYTIGSTHVICVCWVCLIVDTHTHVICVTPSYVYLYTLIQWCVYVSGGTHTHTCVPPPISPMCTQV